MLSPSEHLWRFIPTEFSWTQERVALCHRAPTLSRWKLGESKPSIFRGSDPHRPHLPAPARSRALRSARAVNTRTTSRLYSTDPRRSSLGWAASAARWAARLIAASSGRVPLRAASARVASMAVRPTLVRPIPTWSQAPLAPSVIYRGRGEVADLALELEVGAPAVGRRG